MGRPAGSWARHGSTQQGRMMRRENIRRLTAAETSAQIAAAAEWPELPIERPSEAATRRLVQDVLAEHERVLDGWPTVAIFDPNCLDQRQRLRRVFDVAGERLAGASPEIVWEAATACANRRRAARYARYARNVDEAMGGEA